jgi:enoyl reductase-like protein
MTHHQAFGEVALMTYQEIIERIESLPIEEQDDLFELIRKRRIEQRRTEIATNGERLRQAVQMRTAKSFDNVEDLKSYLFADDEE